MDHTGLALGLIDQIDQKCGDPARLDRLASVVEPVLTHVEEVGAVPLLVEPAGVLAPRTCPRGDEAAGTDPIGERDG